MLSSVLVVLNLRHLISAHLGLRLPSGVGTAARAPGVLAHRLLRRHLIHVLATRRVHLVSVGLMLSLVLARVLIELVSLADCSVGLYCRGIGRHLIHIY